MLGCPDHSLGYTAFGVAGQLPDSLQPKRRRRPLRDHCTSGGASKPCYALAEMGSVAGGVLEDGMAYRRFLQLLLPLLILTVLPVSAAAQPAPGGPPAVGVVRAERQQITQTDEFIGRIQAVGRVALVARVSAFLEKRLVVEGAEVKQGDLLYEIKQPPFQAQVNAAKASIAQLEAQHRNAEVTLERAQYLLKTVAGQQSNVDSALASERSPAAQIEAAKAQLQIAEINLGYTEIPAPIDG